jgi:hypothetical protein
MTKNEDAVRGALIGAVTGVGFGLVGFCLAQIPATKSIGGVMFLLVPIAAGIGIAMVTPMAGAMMAAASRSHCWFRSPF